ncbi:hypothetical protein [Marinobacterium weihaiense]|uniref:Preprotein translocase subunit YajC n=1 Tax=Marinobacterium weihaiense TaxID=2851016 RepID=A0ABS6M6Z6_9GAMM|nr:hypothetical protein [Marinobacterium weihaiense]MBV0931950.1 hypothetical protein [Marinobacterium weihaiense]
MEWLIVVLIFISLTGSVLWIRPTPRQRHQGELRMHARKLGIQVQLTRVELPRARGEVEGESVLVAAYRFLRTNLERGDRERWIDWHIHRLDTLDQAGLAEGWSWIGGTGALPPAGLARLNALLQAVPEDVIGIESTAQHLTLYWRERGEIEALDHLHSAVQPLLSGKV